jgi:hypothetical protein
MLADIADTGGDSTYVGSRFLSPRFLQRGARKKSGACAFAQNAAIIYFSGDEIPLMSDSWYKIKTPKLLGNATVDS